MTDQPDDLSEIEALARAVLQFPNVYTRVLEADWLKGRFQRHMSPARTLRIVERLREAERDAPPLPQNEDLEAIGVVGRKPVISKHRAWNLANIRDAITTLDAQGLHAEADTMAWLVWARVLDRQREEFLSTYAKEDAEARLTAAEARATALEALLAEAGEVVGAIADNPYVVDCATVPNGKQPCDAPDRVVMNLVIMGRDYAALRAIAAKLEARALTKETPDAE